jgi:MFS transporter, OCT family, solute carrier family 22 (organic cation transporter), member 4/5
MYSRNYSEITRLWLDKNPNEILINHKHLLAENKSYEIINCEHGWHYERSMFTATVISEV